MIDRQMPPFHLSAQQRCSPEQGPNETHRTEKWCRGPVSWVEMPEETSVGQEPQQVPFAHPHPVLGLCNVREPLRRVGQVERSVMSGEPRHESVQHPGCFCQNRCAHQIRTQAVITKSCNARDRRMARPMTPPWHSLVQHSTFPRTWNCSRLHWHLQTRACSQRLKCAALPLKGR